MKAAFRDISEFGLGLVAVGLSLMLLLTGAMPICEAVPDEKVVRIGVRAAFTGVVASTGYAYCPGSIDCIRYIDEHGGINGIRVQCAWEDCRSLAALEISTHKRFKQAEVVAEINYLSTGAEITTRLQQRDEIPLMSISYLSDACITYPIRWVFGGVGPWNVYSATSIKWVKENWAESRPLRVGIVFYDHSSGWSSIEGIPEYCAKMGVEYIGHEVVPLLGCIDTSVELLRIAAKKPDWLLFPISGAPLTTVMKDAGRLELQKSGIKLCNTVSAVDHIFIKATGADSENWHVLRHFPAPWETEYAGMAAVNEAAKKYRGWEPAETGELYVAGWLGAAVVIEGIRLAVEKVDLNNLTGHAVRDGMASIKGWETGILPPITLSDDKPWFIDFVGMYQVQQAKAVPISGWIEAVPPQELGSLIIKK